MEKTYRQRHEERMLQYKAWTESSDGQLWIRQYRRYVHPFQMFGNLYYVGDDNICMHLIDTGEGLILCDAGNYGAEGMLVNAIWEAGFSPYDIRWLILSHGHYDHIGGAAFFRAMYGCQILMGKPDAQMFRSRPELALLADTPDCTYQLFEPDVEIEDGQVIRFGGTEISFFLVPGHTEGCLAYFFDVSDGKQTKRAGYYGGFGFNTLTDEYLIQAGDPEFTARQRYLTSLAKVRNQHVDIFMGNHTVNNRLMERRAQMLQNPERNPFLDETAFGSYLDEKKEELLRHFSKKESSSK